MRGKNGLFLRTVVLLLVLCLTAVSAMAEITERIETSRDRVSAREWVDENGKRTAGPEGWARVEYLYKNGVSTPTTERYFDANGKPFVIADGYAKVVRSFGKNGVVTEESFYGVDNKLCISAKGYANAKLGYTSAGDLRSEFYYGVRGDKVIVPSLGYACAMREFRGRTLVSETFMDTNKKPIDANIGYAIRENSLNKKYHVLESRYLHADGTPAAGPEGWYRAEYQNDKNGVHLSVSYFTENDTPWVDAEGVSEYGLTYDKNGNEQTRQLLKNGQPVTGLHGWSKCEFEYDEQGRTICVRYLNADGRPISLGSGYAYTRTIYKKDGSGSVQTRYDTADQPVDQGGYVSLGCDYSEDGKVIRTYFLDAGGKTTANANGIFSTEYGYDEKGRIVTTAFFDETHAPMNGADGWARCEDELDGNGFILVRTCYNADDTVIRTERYQYNEFMVQTGVEILDGGL